MIGGRDAHGQLWRTRKRQDENARRARASIFNNQRAKRNEYRFLFAHWRRQLVCLSSHHVHRNFLRLVWRGVALLSGTRELNEAAQYEISEAVGVAPALADEREFRM